MGTLYYAVGKNNRQAVELGKDSFECLLDTKFDEPTLVKALIRHFEEGFYLPGTCDLDYVKEVARRLLSIDTEFEVVSEHEGSRNYEGIVITQSRYTEGRTFVGDTLSSHLSD